MCRARSAAQLFASTGDMGNRQPGDMGTLQESFALEAVASISLSKGSLWTAPPQTEASITWPTAMRGNERCGNEYSFGFVHADVGSSNCSIVQSGIEAGASIWRLP